MNEWKQRSPVQQLCVLKYGKAFQLKPNGRYLARPRLRGGQHKTIRIIPMIARRNKITLNKNSELNLRYRYNPEKRIGKLRQEYPPGQEENRAVVVATCCQLVAASWREQILYSRAQNECKDSLRKQFIKHIRWWLVFLDVFSRHQLKTSGANIGK